MRLFRMRAWLSCYLQRLSDRLDPVEHITPPPMPPLPPPPPPPDLPGPCGLALGARYQDEYGRVFRWMQVRGVADLTQGQWVYKISPNIVSERPNDAADSLQPSPRPET